MEQQWITVKDVSLNNNCPECFSKEGLEITFKQEFVDAKFSKSITENIKTEMHCNVCDTAIFPVSWTEDIERIYDYRMKAFTPKKASKKYKPLFWFLISGVVLVLGIIAVLVSINWPE